MREWFNDIFSSLMVASVLFGSIGLLSIGLGWLIKATPIMSILFIVLVTFLTLAKLRSYRSEKESEKG